MLRVLLTTAPHLSRGEYAILPKSVPEFKKSFGIDVANETNKQKCSSQKNTSKLGYLDLAFMADKGRHLVF